jgi:hypothetical protein
MNLGELLEFFTDEELVGEIKRRKLAETSLTVLSEPSATSLFM